MRLTDLIESHAECRARLLTAINTDSDYATIQDLDSRMKLLSNSIRDIHVSTPIEINRQIKFFLNRSAGLGDEVMTSSDRQTGELLVGRYTGQPESEAVLGKSQMTIDTQACVNLREQRFLTDDLIPESNARVSLYNLDYRYEYTSLGNARFHGVDPSEFVNVHVVDIIGDQRFKKRAKQYYDRCFGGEHLNYSYFLDTDDQGERLMDCQLTPYRDSIGCVRGVFFAIEDITDKIERATQSALNNAVH